MKIAGVFMSRWKLANCPSTKDGFCWTKSEDINNKYDHFYFHKCANHDDRPAEFVSPNRFCQQCWDNWFTEGYPN